MLTRTTEFYETLPSKCCDTCGEPLEEMADCYTSTCTKCKGHTFYPLSPIIPGPTAHPE
ncbi:protein YhfH [Paenibacillus elgii]|uniref:protein YhfH n=1 Tax=Paenibacillus elgii TaxID=189691 RepID=UPI00031B1FF5|nr:protein YhfH [Paenibacillus elgii]MCM3269907.1 YhfH family protein [Paenibacillus elgii]NEN85816.1 YhfH family protein [Paenibacillus elgii]